MTTVRALVAIPLLALTHAACSDDDSGTPAPTTATPTTLADGGAILIEVTVGTDSGEERIEQVPLGSYVTLTITDPAADQTYHLHGYDLEQEVAAGQPASFSFTADEAGTFEVESHETEEVLVVLEVS